MPFFDGQVNALQQGRGERGPEGDRLGLIAKRVPQGRFGALEQPGCALVKLGILPVASQLILRGGLQ